MTETPVPPFPSDFQWGVSTSAYQIEGAVDADGRGPSIWDTFAHTPGRIADATTGDVACDHYHRMAEDVALMTDLGVSAYRFSIAWPRIVPLGSGGPNPAGVAFYDRLVDTLLGSGIDPVATLFHWDLPQALQDGGGWHDRDTAARFGEYADAMGQALGDRVKLWITLNEPVVHTELGYGTGLHAPGLVGSELLPVVHHQLLGHGLATAALRARGCRVGLANAYSPALPVGTDRTTATATAADRAAVELYDVIHNRVYTDPLLLGKYPDEAAALTGGRLDEVVRDGDLALISAPIDVLGVNYYNPQGVGAPDPDEPRTGHGAGLYRVRGLAGYPETAFGWPVVPDGLRQFLVSLRGQYGDLLPPIWITENGCAYDTEPDADGTLRDHDRITYLDGHIRALRAAMDAGVDVRGYCVWSLLDNWEWAEGFRMRFGLVHVDFATGRRTPKASFDWYRSLIRR